MTDTYIAPTFSIEDLRVLNCFSFNEFQACFNFGTAGEYALGKHAKMRGNLFSFIADLDRGNQRVLREHLDQL